MIVNSGQKNGSLYGVAPLILALLVAIPILVTPLPVLIDFPSHLARYHVEQALPTSGTLARHFTYGWRYIPNLGVDVLVAVLGRLMGVEAAAKLALTAIPTVGAIGMIWISRTVHGRITFATLLALILNYAFPFTFGFVNSCLSVSLALVAFGAWIALIRSGRVLTAAIFGAVAAPVLLTAHIIGYGTFGLMVAGAALADATAQRRPLLAIVIDVSRAALPLAWPLLLLFVWRTSGTATIGRMFDWRLELQWLGMIVRDRYSVGDALTAGILYGVALLPVIARRRFAADRVLLYPALLLWAAALLMPNRVFGSEFAAVRLLSAALTISLLAVRERHGAYRPFVLGALAILAVRLGTTAISLLSTSNEAQRILAALDTIKPGSRVAAIQLVECDRQWTPPRLKLIASYATVRRNAFVNGQFAAVEGQSLGIKPDVPASLALFPTLGTVNACDRLTPIPIHRLVEHLPWASIDYLWLINVDSTSIAVPAFAQPVWSDGRSRLYAIGHPRI